MRAFIIGCAGLTLSAQDRAFIADARPWGFILFKRNVGTPEQVARLAAEFRSVTGRADAPVLIDQEGGRVQRLGPPHWPRYPAASFFRSLNCDAFEQRAFVRLSARLMAHDLSGLGITVDCLPVLDVPVAGAHSVIGDRAYALEPHEVALFARAACEGMLAGGVLPVIKHIPGHGRANADSHLELPIVTTARKTLETHDFLPFQILADMPLAMTAHVVYQAIDAAGPATTSRKIMREIVRGHIGYDGLVMTDDLSMKALAGTFRQRAERAFQAGVDMALHCNGDLGEARAVAEGTPELKGGALARAKAALARIRHVAEPLDVEAAREKLASVFAG